VRYYEYVGSAADRTSLDHEVFPVAKAGSGAWSARTPTPEQKAVELKWKTGNLYTEGGRYFVVNPWRYCRRLEQLTARASGEWAGLGIISAALGLPSAVAGTALVIRESVEDRPSAGVLAPRLGLAAAGYFMSLFSVFALSRSSAASSASAQASLGVKETDDDKKAYEACIEARATWVSSREKAIDAVKAERDRIQSELDKTKAELKKNE
jgi:hypothetical protein